MTNVCAECGATFEFIESRRHNGQIVGGRRFCKHKWMASLGRGAPFYQRRGDMHDRDLALAGRCGCSDCGLEE
jgi:hypothetical protein